MLATVGHGMERGGWWDSSHMHISSAPLSFSSLVLQAQLQALASTSSVTFQALLSADLKRNLEHPAFDCLIPPAASLGVTWLSW